MSKPTNPHAMPPNTTSPRDTHKKDSMSDRTHSSSDRAKNKESECGAVDPAMSLMTLFPSNFKVLSVDEEDIKNSELEYPTRRSEEDNDVMDQIVFAVTIQRRDRVMWESSFEDVGEEDIVERETGEQNVGLEQEMERKPEARYQHANLYRCEVCGEAFEWKTWLQTHMNSHKGGMDNANEGELLDGGKWRQMVEPANKRDTKARNNRSQQHQEKVAKTNARDEDSKLQSQLQRLGGPH